VSARLAAWPEIRVNLERSVRAALGDERRERTCLIVLAAAMAGYAALAMYLTRGVTLFVDGEQLFVQNRGLDPVVLFAPLNGHLVLMERSVYAAGFALFPGDYVVFRVVEIAGVLLAVGLLFVYMRRRIGSLGALPLALLVLFLGSAWEVTIVPDVMTNTYSAAAGIGALLALDRRDRRGDLLACALLVTSVACWTLGVAFVIGAATRIALEPRPRRRVWVAALPLALYAAWLAWVHLATLPDHIEVGQNVTFSRLLLIPNLVADEAAAVVNSLVGLNYDFSQANPLAPFATDLGFGIPLAALAAAVLGYRLFRGRTRPALWCGIVAMLGFWVLLAIGFGIGRSPTTVRYVYPGAILVLVVAAETLRGLRISGAVALALAAGCVFALGTNLYRLRQGGMFLRDYATNQRAELSAIEIARARVRSGFTVPTQFLSWQAGPYLEAVARNGSPAYTPAELSRQPEAVREAADSTLVKALRLNLRTPPHPHGVPQGHCRRFAPSPSGGALFTARPPGILVGAQAAAAISVGRFADQPAVSLGSTRGGKLSVLPIPRDAGRAPWQVAARANGRPVKVCGLSR
jgi:hypothetical protein